MDIFLSTMLHTFLFTGTSKWHASTPHVHLNRSLKHIAGVVSVCEGQDVVFFQILQKTSQFSQLSVDKREQKINFLFTENRNQETVVLRAVWI